jgi:uracil-DNA glycosylase family 4
VGEGPGQMEDWDGKPFVGPAGELLQRIIDDAVPDTVRYVLTNVVCCMPTDADGLKSGEPTQEQLRFCATRLREFVALADPKLIVCVGSVAEDWLDVKNHHHVSFHRPIPMVAVKHPAAILRSNIAARGLDVQNCVTRIANAITDLGLDGSDPSEADAPRPQDEPIINQVWDPITRTYDDDIPF